MAGKPNGYVFPPPRRSVPEAWQVPMNYLQTDASRHPMCTPPPPPMPPNFRPENFNHFTNGTIGPPQTQLSFNMQGKQYSSNGFPGPTILLSYNHSSPRTSFATPAPSTPMQPFRFHHNHNASPQRHKFHNKNNMFPRGMRGYINDQIGAEKEPIHAASDEDANIKFFCEPCEKEFKTLKDKEAHCKGHAKCEVENCSFIASRKVLKLHFIQKHEEGRFRIVLRNEEDIKKWREERRKNYPKNSRQRDKERVDKEKRRKGNVLETRSFRYNSRDSWQVNSKYQVQRDQEQREKNNNLQMLSNSADTDLGDKKFKSHESADSDREVKHDDDHAQNALTSLQSFYESSSDEEMDENDILNSKVDTKPSENTLKSDLQNEDIGIHTINGSNEISNASDVREASGFTDQKPVTVETRDKSLNIITKSNGPTELNELTIVKCSTPSSHKDGMRRSLDIGLEKQHCHDLYSNSAEDCNSEEKEIDKELNKITFEKVHKDGVPRKDVTTSNDRKRAFNKNDNSAAHHHTWKRNRKPTLLEMLLANDIRHERNIILQCIRHIIVNNFFEN